MSLVAAIAKLHSITIALGDNRPGLAVRLQIPMGPKTAELAGPPGASWPRPEMPAKAAE
jgi:hypothetical protein